MRSSSDGNVLVGTGQIGVGASLPYVYTPTGGVQWLSVDPAYSTVVSDISGDGSLAVGSERNTPTDGYGVMWNLATGARTVISIPGVLSATVLAVSTDGKVVGGSALYAGGVGAGGNGEAIIATLASSPTVTRLDPTAIYAGGSSVTKLNSDGSVAVGAGIAVPGSLDFAGWRWTSTGGLVSLGYLPGTTSTLPISVNAAGDVVVGLGTDNTSTFRSFRWTSATGLASLGTLHGDATSQSAALDVNGSGDVVVGFSANATSVDGYR